jgi:hypothetical protein
MEAWAAVFPQDVLDECAFYAQKKSGRKAEKDGIRAPKRFIEAQEAGPSMIDDDDHWLDMFLSEPWEWAESDYDLLRLDVSIVSV